MSSTPVSDAQLIARAVVQDDRHAFGELVRRHQSAVRSTLRRLTGGNIAQADDLAQETFLLAYRNLKSFRQEAKFSTWLYRIACNHCLSRLRQRPPGVQYSLDDASPENPIHRSLPVHDSHERAILSEERRRRVRLALDQLTPDQKAVVELRFFQELTLEEIAVIVQLPLGTIKSRLYAGLEALKMKLGRSSLKATRR